ncbi:hypothetical protein [Xanthovirga aplysinae]|uniref:hypothetical protein n=1 Tax=Xanthovirga aplysinae TaxID=2529853 RepID=UPI0012BC77F4|nr:hypothetical protein [Xanthovirga aplysinae]MTI31387.1 hypothetical protein [Xanthovirga aplysinae]
MKEVPFIRHILAFLSFVIPTLIIGFTFKFKIFKEEYDALNMHRENIALLFAFGSLFIQGVFWPYICSTLFLQDSFLRRTLKLFSLAFPLGFSFGVCVIAAKHVMTSLEDFVVLETGFTLIMYAVVCPLISMCYTVLPRR